jgi:hypothetical protein
MSLRSTQDIRNEQSLPLQQPAAPGTLPEDGIKAHCSSSLTQEYTDPAAVSHTPWYLVGWW